jgi:hypothetical protein
MSPVDISQLTADAPALVELQKAAPQLRIWTVSSDDFEDLSAVFLKNNVAKPLAVVRPQSEDEVAATVAYASSRGIPLSVRAGGHDHRGRTRPEQALVLDMRDLQSVEVVDDGRAAVVGGGCLAQGLLDALGKTGHVAAVGASGTVGWVGWATHGGYGSYAGLYGLGCDQVLGARIVNHQGEIVDADDELLYGIRGAGSAFGVIVAIKIKIYKLEHVCLAMALPFLHFMHRELTVSKILAGTLIFAVSPVEDGLDEFLQKYQNMIDAGIPRELGLDAGVCNISNVGRSVICSFLWASEDAEAGQVALERMQDLAPIAASTVGQTTPAEYLRMFTATWPSSLYASQGFLSVSIPSFDQDVRRLMVDHTKVQPANPISVWLEHHPHGAALQPNPSSCFGYRQPHFMLELLGCSPDEQGAKESADWARSFFDDARKLSSTLQGGYISLVPAGVSAELCYPGHWERLQKLKRSVDPHNVFRFNITGLGGSS